MESPRVLLIVKYKEDSGGHCAYDGTPHSFGGLYNSASFIVQMLKALGIWAKLVQVCDNNFIDAEVAKWKPTHVIIEALWVVPEKFVVLHKLHPKVQWIVRCHSEIPFIAYEGIAIEWLSRYVQLENVSIASNSKYGVRDFLAIVRCPHKVHYLPNWYPTETHGHPKKPNRFLDVGCFGAIRPLKNQLIQALAAAEWAHRKHQPLRFHVNGRTEQGGESVLKNLRALMRATGNELVEHPWAPREEFLKRVAAMDVGMQVSFSETFDITAADTVAVGVPLVTSSEVIWSAPICQAIPTNTASILARLEVVTGTAKKLISLRNWTRLFEFSEDSQDIWDQFVRA